MHDPRALAVILEKAEEDLEAKRHPDPYTRAFHWFQSLRWALIMFPSAACSPGGTKWWAIRTLLIRCVAVLNLYICELGKETFLYVKDLAMKSSPKLTLCLAVANAGSFIRSRACSTLKLYDPITTLYKFDLAIFTY